MKKVIRSWFTVHSPEDGQSLITLLFFMVIGIAVISSAALIVTADLLSSSNAEQGQSAYYVAESGIENGILYLLRHPKYDNSSTSPMTISVGSGQASVVFTYNSGANTDTIVSTGTSGTTTRIIQAVGSYATGPLTIGNWKEQ